MAAPRKPGRKREADRPSIAFPDAAPKVVEGFRVGVAVHSREPTAVNWLSIRRYRVTTELIDEPVEALRGRLRELWRTSQRNSHNWDAFRQAAAELGIELSLDDCGADYKERRW